MFCFESWTASENRTRWSESHASSYFTLEEYLPEMSECALICDSKKVEYYNLCERAMRKKFFQLSTTNLFTQSLMCTIVVIHDIAILLFALPFNLGGEDNNRASLSNRVAVTGCALMHILTLPFAICGLECMAIIGIFTPKDGRKYYSQLEEWIYMKTGANRWKLIKSYLTLAFFPAKIVDRYGGEEGGRK